MFSEHCIRTLVLAPSNERIDKPMKEEYITEINNLLPLADVELLDFVFQLLQKSIDKPIKPLTEHQLSA